MNNLREHTKSDPLERATSRDDDLSPDGATEHGDACLELSVVIPCLDEAETIETCVRKAVAWLAQNGVQGEVVVGDNGSSDGSQELAARAGARVVDVPVRGYGAALYYATCAASGRYVIMGDADDSYDFSDMMPFLRELRNGNELVMGNRFLGGIEPGAMPWKNRFVGNPILSGIGRLFFRSVCKDFHCGMRGFAKAAFDRMDLRTTGMEYASEMVIKATLLGMRIREVPTRLWPDGRSRQPHLRPWRDGWRHLRFMMLYSPRWLYLYPGLALMVLGSLLGTWVWMGPRHVFGIGLDVHTLVYAAAAVMIGFQAVLFAFLSKTYAMMEGLLPEDAGFGRWQKHFTLELGLTVGILLVLLGVFGSFVAVWYWRARGFGPLEPTRELRVVVPSALALSLGSEIVLSSFFFSVLGLRVRRLKPPSLSSQRPQ
jgi:glycosyltransferase involved in cell wall biosynthesis